MQAKHFDEVWWTNVFWPKDQRYLIRFGSHRHTIVSLVVTGFIFENFFILYNLSRFYLACLDFVKVKKKDCKAMNGRDGIFNIHNHHNGGGILSLSCTLRLFFDRFSPFSTTDCVPCLSIFLGNLNVIILYLWPRDYLHQTLHIYYNFA